MKRLLLAGGGQAHVLVLRDMARRRLTGVEIVLVTPSSQLRYSGMLPGWMPVIPLEELTIDVAPLAQAASARFVLAHVQNSTSPTRPLLPIAAKPSNSTCFDRHGSRDRRRFDRGAREHALPLRPFEDLSPVATHREQAEAARETFRLTVIGGGAAGAEMPWLRLSRRACLRRFRCNCHPASCRSFPTR